VGQTDNKNKHPRARLVVCAVFVVCGGSVVERGWFPSVVTVAGHDRCTVVAAVAYLFLSFSGQKSQRPEQRGVNSPLSPSTGLALSPLPTKIPSEPKMSYHSYKKPENALRRAQELYKADKKQLGIEILNSVLNQRRHKQWTTTHEELIKLYLKICVDLRKKMFARDGLYQYRSLCQREAPGSLEVVVNHLIDLAEEKCVEAMALAGNRVKLSELVADDDENAAENIILTSVNSHGTSRVDKELVVPWIKFLWEAYRSVLEVTKNNNRLIDVYQSTCLRAYKFCEKYERTLEFRKLNDMIKKHLQDSIKYYDKDRESGKKQSLIELNAEYFELHLDSRFIGLKAATDMKQWNQAYQIVEEIYGIMAKIDRPIQPQMMAAYYKSLSDMFLVSKSYLFHAYAWLKFYHLNEKNNQSLDSKELTRMASALTLSALAVPVVKRHDSISSYANDEADKKKRMGKYMSFATNNIYPFVSVH
jgi:translation initiation factor 3 subunit A